MPSTPRIVAFQGFPGAYSDLAARKVFPRATTKPCLTFEEVFEKVRRGTVDIGIIPIDNSIAGRVADIHLLLPHSGVHIIGEHFEKIDHRLLGVPGATLRGLREVRSHMHALNQCRGFIHRHKLKAVIDADTAGAARMVAKLGDARIGAIASSLARKLYGLSELARNLEDSKHNVTRFICIGKKAIIPRVGARAITSFVFRVRSVPAALFKAIGGFATNGVNIIKLESYIVDSKFTVAQFYVEIEGHPKEPRVRLAFEELHFFSEDVTILGTYRGHPFRTT